MHVYVFYYLKFLKNIILINLYYFHIYNLIVIIKINVNVDICICLMEKIWKTHGIFIYVIVLYDFQRDV